MKESMCEGCANLITKGADGTEYEPKYRYCAKRWRNELRDAMYICRGRMKRLNNGSKK